MSEPLPTSEKNGWMPKLARRQVVGFLVCAGVVAAIGVKWRRDLAYGRALEKCASNLERIDQLKELYALEHNLKPGDSVRVDELLGQGHRFLAEGPRYLNDRAHGEEFWTRLPVEPFGGYYVINAIGHDVECSLGHTIPVIPYETICE